MKKYFIFFWVAVLAVAFTACERIVIIPNEETSVSPTDKYFPEPSINWWASPNVVKQEMVEKGYKVVVEDEWDEVMQVGFLYHGMYLYCFFNNGEYGYCTLGTGEGGLSISASKEIINNFEQSKYYAKTHESNEGGEKFLLFEKKDGETFVYVNSWKDSGEDNCIFVYGPMKSSLYDDYISYVFSDPISGIEASHEWVDLGLPSGILWATCNVGANKSYECGDYFSWGETTPKTYYNSNNYKYSSNSKYNSSDELTTLSLMDDAAYKNWGGKWRMPTAIEQDELVKNCNWTLVTKSGVYGYEVKSKKNDNAIFIPIAGRGTETRGVVVDGYWSSSLTGVGSAHAKFLIVSSSEYEVYWNNRYVGFPIRAVCTR